MEKITILGTPPAKSNTYNIITLKGKDGKHHSSLGKSPEAKQYEKNFYIQVPAKHRKADIREDFGIIINEVLPTRGHDIDNPLKIILDSLQKSGVIHNDNLCRAMVVSKYKGKGKIDYQILPLEFFAGLNKLIAIIQGGGNETESLAIIQRMQYIYDNSTKTKTNG